MRRRIRELLPLRLRTSAATPNGHDLACGWGWLDLRRRRWWSLDFTFPRRHGVGLGWRGGWWLKERRLAVGLNRNDAIETAPHPSPLPVRQGEGEAAGSLTLTPASAHEQAHAGLDRLDTSEIEAFQKYNQKYRDQFGFPFIICARLNQKESILAAFPIRLLNDRDSEIQTALDEIAKIARLRLDDLIQL